MYSLRYLLGLVFVVVSSFASAQSVPAVGDLHESYRFEPTNEAISYRLYVPAAYDGKSRMPLVVVLHGGGRDENQPIDGDGGVLKQLAEKYGYIVLSPRGYNAFGGYGNIYPIVVTRETAAASTQFAKEAAALSAAAPAAPAGAHGAPSNSAVAADDYVEQPAAALTDARINQLSEQEVLAAIADVRRTYLIDPARTYLTGNSMGGAGTAYLAVKYPALWAAVSPGGGPIAAWSYPFRRLRSNNVAALFVHGEFDEHSNPHWSAALADAAKAEGVDAEILIVKGGHHGDSWFQALPQIFEFFSRYQH